MIHGVTQPAGIYSNLNCGPEYQKLKQQYIYSRSIKLTMVVTNSFSNIIELIWAMYLNDKQSSLK